MNLNHSEIEKQSIKISHSSQLRKNNNNNIKNQSNLPLILLLNKLLKDYLLLDYKLTIEFSFKDLEKRMFILSLGKKK